MVEFKYELKNYMNFGTHKNLIFINSKRKSTKF